MVILLASTHGVCVSYKSGSLGGFSVRCIMDYLPIHGV